MLTVGVFGDHLCVRKGIISLGDAPYMSHKHVQIMQSQHVHSTLIHSAFQICIQENESCSWMCNFAIILEFLSFHNDIFDIPWS